MRNRKGQFVKRGRFSRRQKVRSAGGQVIVMPGRPDRRSRFRGGGGVLAAPRGFVSGAMLKASASVAGGAVVSTWAVSALGRRWAFAGTPFGSLAVKLGLGLGVFILSRRWMRAITAPAAVGVAASAITDVVAMVRRAVPAPAPAPAATLKGGGVLIEASPFSAGTSRGVWDGVKGLNGSRA